VYCSTRYSNDEHFDMIESVILEHFSDSNDIRTASVAECRWSGVSIPGLAKSKTEKLVLAASLVSVHHLRPKAGLVGPVSV